MSTYEFKLPDIGEGVAEGEIVKWLIQPGDVVTEDQPMVEVMTDKATVTITAPKSGKILETRGEVGGVIPVHAVLVVFDLQGAEFRSSGGAAGAAAPPAAAAADSRGAPKPASSGSDGPAATAVGDIKEDLPGMNLLSMSAAPRAVENGGAAISGYFNAKPLATPATRKLARDLNVDLRVIPPSGPNGRVTKDDVRTGAGVSARAGAVGAQGAAGEHAGADRDRERQPEASAQAGGAGRDAASPGADGGPRAQPGRAPVRIAPSQAAGEAAGDERIPLRGMRKRIFEGMARSKHTAAHFTFVEECDVTALKALRERLKPAAEKNGVKLTYLPFFVKACVAALKRHPTLNSAFDEETQEIVVRRAFHIGIASATEQGLIVPVVRDADRKSILDVAREIARLSEDTKTGKVKPQDLGGSTFTITSLGQRGGLFATPILNFPEVAILGVHQIKQKPVVRGGQIVIGDVMLLSLSFDHRIIDGHIGAAFAYEIIELLQDPDRLFLEMA
jgi:pyruvate dehydrogenase E2 component (dihydrolipoamide acetyltransferase)